MPIYVRAGSIIPVDPVRQYMGQPVTTATTLKVFGGTNGAFTMYEDDGNSQDYIQNRGTWTKLAWEKRASVYCPTRRTCGSRSGSRCNRASIPQASCMPD